MNNRINKTILSFLLVGIAAFTSMGMGRSSDPLLMQQKAKDSIDALFQEMKELKDTLPDEALDKAEQALQWEKKTGLPVNYQLHQLTGQLYQKQRNYQDVLQTYIPLLETKEVQKDSLEQLRLRYLLGFNYRKIEIYEKALENYLITENLATRLQHEGYLSKSYMGLAFVYRNIGKREPSKHYFNQVIDLARKHKDHLSESIALNELGNHAQREKKLDKAIEFHTQALEIKLQQKDSSSLAYSYNDLATDYMVKKDYDHATKLLKKSVLFSKKYDNTSCYVASLNNLAEVAQAQGNYKLAIHQFEQAYQQAKASKIMSREARIARNISQLYKEIGNSTKALKYLERYIELNDSLLNEQSARELSRQQIKYETEKLKRTTQLLSQENQIQKMDLRQNRMLLYSLLVVLLLLIVIGRIRWQRNLSRKDQHLAELRMKALGQQMNPHFLFNTLNSIQRFILSNERNTSSAYLTKFSRLMRMALEHSEKDLIPLAEDMDALNRYLEMEALRFGQQFEFSIETKGLDTEEHLVPPFLIQPLAENAIKHGLRHLDKNTKGKLHIRWFLAKEHLHCVIEDNGIGRKKAGEIREQFAQNHKSRGLQITKQRIELLQKVHKHPSKMEFTDLYNNNNQAMGTRIEVSLPLFQA
ncbi:MAG: tetratricopeptide repeat protein [Marinifilaceae bacterium]